MTNNAWLAFHYKLRQSAEEIIQQVSMAEQYTLANEAEEVDEQNSMAEQYALTNEAKQANVNIFVKVSQRIATAQEKQKRNYAKRKSVVDYNFKVGDKVLWRNMLQLTKKGHKMEDRWLGPYVVANSKGTCFLLNKAGLRLKKRVRLSQLKPYISAPDSSSLQQCVVDKAPIAINRPVSSSDEIDASTLGKGTFLIATESSAGTCMHACYTEIYLHVLLLCSIQFGRVLLHCSSDLSR